MEEAAISEEQTTPRPAAAVEELIESMESDVVHGMDDRVSISSESSEDSMIVRDDEQGTTLVALLLTCMVVLNLLFFKNFITRAFGTAAASISRWG